MSYVIGWPQVLLRLEGLGILLISLLVYATAGYSWNQFAWLFLVPDIALFGYLINARIGSIAYNTTHSLLLPLGLLAAGVVLNLPTALAIALIWIAHIGFDRALGYGLKYSSGFAHTHLGKIGKNRFADNA